MSEISFTSRYELLEVIGQGGMATVWRGVARGAAGFRRPVAIKRVLPALLDHGDSLRMFVEEARVGSQLHHPNIVQIFDFGEDEQGGYFLVMEWVDGLDLRRYLAAYEQVFRTALPWPLACAIAVEALRGLDAAHRRTDAHGQPCPVIHRDVTPHNIMLSTQGVIKLTDFGLARATDRARMTHPDVIKGKLGYLAPELSFGREASVRSDLFSLGIVLWEALAGRKLYEGDDDVAIFRAARKAEVPDLNQQRGDLPAELVQLVDRALCRNPADRFGSAREMLLGLTKLLRSLPEPTDAPLISRTVRQARTAVAGLAQVNERQSPARPAAPPPPRAGGRRAVPPEPETRRQSDTCKAGDDLETKPTPPDPLRRP